MSSFIATKKYLCDLRHALGSGSYANVHMGFEQVSGEPVAIKVFKKIVYQHNLSQEFEVLKSVAHDNIVRFISIENHPQFGILLVMELCSEGSLENVLQKPRNLYGLDEDEFLLLLTDMTAGMKYLRGKNLIHRDIKPGNILRSRRSDGQFIYKLSDFGSARILEDGDSFSSIYGTVEYLHPDIYAAYATSQRKNFKATVDLWSIGVTLYHAATGEIPFKAFEGGRDKTTTFRILSTKPKGAISGKQMEPRGPILWKQELPTSCRWNSEFRTLITRFLSGLLEADPKLTWSFYRFFAEVDEIASLKKIVIFHVNHLRFLEVYLKSYEGRCQLEEAITKQTSLKQEEQVLVSKHNLLDEEEKHVDYFASTKAEPLILLGMGRIECGGPMFFNIDPSLQGLANEYINERIIDDLIVTNGLCKVVGKVMYSIVFQRKKICHLKMNHLIQLWQVLKQNNTFKQSVVKNLQQLKNKTLVSLETILPARAILQDKDGIFKIIENSTSEIKTLQAKIREYRKSVFSSTNTDQKTQFPQYILGMTKDLTHLYSSCEIRLQTLINHIQGWCEDVMVTFGEIKTVEGHINDLTNILNQALVKRNSVNKKPLDQQLKQLDDVCKEVANLLHSQTSIIQDVIAAGVKASDVLELGND